MVLDALRSLRSSRSTTAFILLILTLTISAATVTFSVVDAVVLRPLPFPNSSRLVLIQQHVDDGIRSRVSFLSASQFLALRDRIDAFDGIAAASRGSLQVGESERLESARVTASLFEVLQAPPLLGRTFTVENETAGNDDVAVIGYALWRRRFGGNPAVIGTTINTRERSFRVLGVMPEGFSFPIASDRPTEVWTPYVIPADAQVNRRQTSDLQVVGRLGANRAIAQVQAMADATWTALAASQPDRFRSGRFVASSLKSSLVGAVRGWMLMVLVAVTLLVAVACANVANLLLTRAIYRTRELAIRAALGATRRRLVSSLLLESLILSLGATLLALVAANWGISAAKASLPAGIARAHAIALDVRVFAAAVSASILIGLVFGLIPAVQASRQDLIAWLKYGSTLTGDARRWRTSVLVAQVSLVSVVLVAMTLFVSSFIRVATADLGFDRANLLVVTTPVRAVTAGVVDVVQTLEMVPGVVAVGGTVAGSPPLVLAGFGTGFGSGTRLQLPGAGPGGEFVNTEFNNVTTDYFKAAAIPLRQGRVFDKSEIGSTNVVVLDEQAARRLFGDQNPLGRDLVYASNMGAKVIGVVANVRIRGPEGDGGAQAYFPIPPPGAKVMAMSQSYVLRISRPARDVAPAIQVALAPFLPAGSAPLQVRAIEDAFRNITVRRRYTATWMAIFGILALLIGAAGIYGVMSSLVAQRTREIGVRMALGASTRRMVGDVLRQMGQYLGLGLLIGLPVAWLVAKMFTGLFYQVHESELWIYFVVAGVLLVVGLLAALLPARRAALVDPLIALRTE